MADPSLAEGAACEGTLTVVANAHGEVVAVAVAHGAGVAPAHILRCTRIAVAKVRRLQQHLAEASHVIALGKACAQASASVALRTGVIYMSDDVLRGL